MKIKDIQALLEKWGYRCAYCHRPMTRETYQIEHFIPKCAGGKEGDNLVISCLECNTSKGQRVFVSIADARIALGFHPDTLPPAPMFEARRWSARKRRQNPGDRKAQWLRWYHRHRTSRNEYNRRWMANSRANQRAQQSLQDGSQRAGRAGR